MKYAVFAILAVGYIACGAYFAHMQRDDAREARWHVLQQHESIGSLTVDERVELEDLNRWAQARGERAVP